MLKDLSAKQLAPIQIAVGNKIQTLMEILMQRHILTSQRTVSAITISIAMKPMDMNSQIGLSQQHLLAVLRDKKRGPAIIVDLKRQLN